MKRCSVQKDQQIKKRGICMLTVMAERTHSGAGVAVAMSLPSGT